MSKEKGLEADIRLHEKLLISGITIDAALIAWMFQGKPNNLMVYVTTFSAIMCLTIAITRTYTRLNKLIGELKCLKSRAILKLRQ